MVVVSGIKLGESTVYPTESWILIEPGTCVPIHYTIR